MFYKEINCKDTEIGKIPRDWEIKKAKQICAKVTDGTHDTPKPAEKGYYLITSKHIKDGKIDFSEAYFISEKDYHETNKRSKVDLADVLFSMIGTVGETAIVKENYPSFTIKNVGLLKTNGNYLLAYWLHYYFKSSCAKRYIRDNLKGTTQKYIPLHTLRDFPIVLPENIKEMKKIVEILNTIDKAIDKTDEIIAKTEKLKRGLMQKLLTKGIGHKEFKYSEELGCKIPKEWEVVRLGNIFRVETGTTPSTKKKEYWKNGTINWITPTDLSKLNGKIHISNSERKITKEALRDHNLTLLPKGSIIVSTRAPVGYVAVLDIDATFNQGCKGLISKSSEINTEFYCYYFLSIKRKLEQLSGGSTFKELSKNALECIRIPLPPLPEQQKIAEILSTVDKKLELEKKRKEKLERVKKSLMEILLSGKVRVRV